MRFGMSLLRANAGPIGAILTSIALLIGPPAPAAELVRLTEKTWGDYAPHGKEADCIYGDYVLRNKHFTAVIANPIEGRNANMTVRDVGGCVIDMTVDPDDPVRQSDQLSAYYPLNRAYTSGVQSVDFTGLTQYRDRDGELQIEAREIMVRCGTKPVSGQPQFSVSYLLSDDRRYLLVESTVSNDTGQPVELDLADQVRADRSFTKAGNGPQEMFWVHDEWFGQAYALLSEQGPVQCNSEGDRSSYIRYASEAGKTTIPTGGRLRLKRRLYAAEDLLELKAVAKGAETGRFYFDVHSPDDREASTVELNKLRVSVKRTGEEQLYGSRFADSAGSLPLPGGDFEITVSAAGRPDKTLAVTSPPAKGKAAIEVTLDDAAWLAAEVTDEHGRPIPSKTEFRGRDGTPDPQWGPDGGEHAVQNLYYDHTGKYLLPLAPGAYDVIVSHGPEYDAVFAQVELARGQVTPLRATLVHSVKTPGWISADFHSHSSPSGDNTSSQLGRVLNLLCEHIEFAPCTEHNRITSYNAHLKRLGIERLLATCSGMELTGSVLPVNHQNAFPLIEKPRTQDGGAPKTDSDPELQIERLALWDDRSEKLVQENHPDIGWVFFDRDEDGQPDKGFEKMAGFMDAIEIHPPGRIFDEATYERAGKRYNNTILNWLQLLNQGYRLTGVVNTDAHYNFHGSGFLRNYLKSPSDDPAQINTIDMVHAAERGNVIVTNGPFLEVLLEGTDDQGTTVRAIPGEDLAIPSRNATLHVRVQCANWFDIDRVQVFLNGRPDESLNFSREKQSDGFAGGAVRFEQAIPLELPGDAHVIVAAAGQRTTLGPVMGPAHGKDMPIAVSNPIYVDVDGGGFKSNGDTLGAPLPVKGGRAVQ